MHRSPEFIFFQRESLFRAVGAAIQLNSGIYLLLRRNYVRANLTHSKVAIIHGATFPTPGLPVASCHPSQGFLAHKCGNGFSKNSLCLLPRILWCVSESDKLYRQVKLQKEASESLDQYQHKGERFSKEDNETSEGRFQTV